MVTPATIDSAEEKLDRAAERLAVDQLDILSAPAGSFQR